VIWATVTGFYLSKFRLGRCVCRHTSLTRHARHQLSFQIRLLFQASSPSRTNYREPYSISRLTTVTRSYLPGTFKCTFTGWITPNPWLCHQLLKEDQGKAWVRWANQRLCTQKAQHKYQNGSIFLMLPTNYTKVKVLVESLWWQRLNGSKQGLKAEINCYQKSKGRRGKVETHTGSKIGFPWFSKSETESRWHAVETSCSRDGWRPQKRQLDRGLKAAR